MNKFYLDKTTMLLYLKELAKLLKKNNSLPCELIIVGGGSILLNYSFRESTVDIDCIDTQGILMNDIISQITSKYDLPDDWINTDFYKTTSYTDKLIRYSSYYTTLSNVLEIRTIKDEYLLAMKMKASRDYKHDLSDICGIANELLQSRGKPVVMQDIKKAVRDLYGDENVISKETYDYVEKIINDPSIYDEIVEFEAKNKVELDKKHQIAKK